MIFYYSGGALSNYVTFNISFEMKRCVWMGEEKKEQNLSNSRIRTRTTERFGVMFVRHYQKVAEKQGTFYYYLNIYNKRDQLTLIYLL